MRSCSLACADAFSDSWAPRLVGPAFVASVQVDIRHMTLMKSGTSSAWTSLGATRRFVHTLAHELAVASARVAWPRAQAEAKFRGGAALASRHPSWGGRLARCIRAGNSGHAAVRVRSARKIGAGARL